MADPVDDHLRARLAFALDTDPCSVLVDLAPSLRHGRRSHRLKTAFAGVTMLAMTAGAAATVVTDGRGDRQTTIAAVSSPGSSDRTDPIPASTAVPASTDTPDPQRSTDGSQPGTAGDAESGHTASLDDGSHVDESSATTSGAGAATTAVPGAGSAPRTRPGATESTTAASSSSTTTVPASTTTTTTTTGAITVDSVCGSIDVAADGNEVVLVDVRPNTGFRVDENNDGPEQIEVSFEGPSGHCELRAEIRNGLLLTDVEEE